METLIVILLAVIAYILWKMYHQKEEEIQTLMDEKFDAEWEEKRKEQFKHLPHLFGKIEDSWLQVFGEAYVERNISHINAAFLMYLKLSNNSDWDMDVDSLFDSLWDLTEELWEHLEEHHASTKYEYEIAFATLWQNVSEAAEQFVGKDIETIKKMFQLEPFTDIEKIPNWFPKNSNHPEVELTFRDSKGNFPRESNGSEIIHKRVTV